MSGSLFKIHNYFFKNLKKKKLTLFYATFLCGRYNVFKKIQNIFCPQKIGKTTIKSCSEKLKSTFFFLMPAQPKRPKQKNSCSKVWLIDQLYIELGPYCPNI